MQFGFIVITYFLPSTTGIRHNITLKTAKIKLSLQFTVSF